MLYTQIPQYELNVVWSYILCVNCCFSKDQRFFWFLFFSGPGKRFSFCPSKKQKNRQRVYIRNYFVTDLKKTLHINLLCFICNLKLIWKKLTIKAGLCKVQSSILVIFHFSCICTFCSIRTNSHIRGNILSFSWIYGHHGRVTISSRSRNFWISIRIFKNIPSLSSSENKTANKAEQKKQG